MSEQGRGYRQQVRAYRGEGPGDAQDGSLSLPAARRRGSEKSCGSGEIIIRMMMNNNLFIYRNYDNCNNQLHMVY